MDSAELIRPTKDAPPDPGAAAAHAGPAPVAAPSKKQKPLAAGVMGKASKPSGPLKPPVRSSSTAGGTSAVGMRVSSTGVKPGGGAAAALASGGAGAAPTFAQQQAQEERERKKREREERRAKASAAAERSTVGSASGTARSTTSDLPEVRRGRLTAAQLGLSACPGCLDLHRCLR